MSRFSFEIQLSFTQEEVSKMFQKYIQMKTFKAHNNNFTNTLNLIRNSTFYRLTFGVNVVYMHIIHSLFGKNLSKPKNYLR